jgi:squalene-hopene/tetraprenyl-beta-curcumene cyclase
LRRVDTSLTLEARSAIRRACRSLVARQLPDGSWAAHPAVTSLAALALLNAPDATAAEHAAAARRGAAAVAEALPLQLDADGTVQRPYPVLTTAVAVLCLVRLDETAHTPLLRRARAFLLAAQRLDLPAADPAHGGFAGAPGAPPDLTTSEYVLEALYLTDHLDRDGAAAAAADPAATARADQAYAAALAFVGRCQERRPGEAAPPTPPGLRQTPGWFRDAPPGIHDGVPPGTPRGIGYLTAAGLKSLLYAGTAADDPGVTAALDWFRAFFRTDANPELGAAGYYTYLFTATKAFHAWERRRPTAVAGGPPETWRRDVVLALLTRQSGDGGWRCQAPDWWETRPELTTAYALITLELALRD